MINKIDIIFRSFFGMISKVSNGCFLASQPGNEHTIWDGSLYRVVLFFGKVRCQQPITYNRLRHLILWYYIYIYIFIHLHSTILDVISCHVILFTWRNGIYGSRWVRVMCSMPSLIYLSRCSCTEGGAAAHRAPNSFHNYSRTQVMAPWDCGFPNSLKVTSFFIIDLQISKKHILILKVFLLIIVHDSIVLIVVYSIYSKGIFDPITNSDFLRSIKTSAMRWVFSTTKATGGFLKGTLWKQLKTIEDVPFVCFMRKTNLQVGDFRCLKFLGMGQDLKMLIIYTVIQ